MPNEMEDPFYHLFEQRLTVLEKYPSVLRRLVMACNRANTAQSLEEVNEVGLHCRELLNDYAKSVYSPDFSEEKVSDQDTKALFKATIQFYSKDAERGVLNSLLEFVDKTVRYLNQVTHSYSFLPTDSKMCVDLCITLICSIENVVITKEQEESAMYEHFGVLKCPRCRSLKLNSYSKIDYKRDELYYFIQCQECDWSDWTQ